MFNINDINIKIVLLVAILVLLIFFGGKYLLNRYRVEQPLIDELQSLDGINSIELIDNNNKTTITISPEHNVDFYNLYKQIEKTANQQLGPDSYDIIFIDENNQYLNLVYYNLHYAIYEGIATKKFTVMQKRVEEIVSENNLSDYELWIDSDNLYLKLVNNDNSLYKVIPLKQFSLNDVQGGVDSG